MNQWQADFLKPIDQIIQPDPRNLYGFRSIDEALHAHYNLISNISLNKYVYNDIKVQFESAKNAFIYSFYAYRLSMLAVHQAIASTEFALRRIIGDPSAKRKETLQPLLQKAHDMNLIDVKRIRSHMDIASFKKFLGGFRNDLSHGTHTLMPPHLMAPIIQDCAHILNQLFENADAQQLKPTWNAWQ